jgi:glycerol-3-phosphate acyltransferase PlsY
VRLLRHEDIRKVGSGNIGATNVWRTYGRWLGIPVILLDIAKGFAPALVATLLVSDLAGILAGAAAMIGHARPLFLRFARGGKMVATMASLLAALGLPVCCFVYGEPWSVRIFAAAAAVAVFVLHRANLKRLRMGTENPLPPAPRRIHSPVLVEA